LTAAQALFRWFWCWKPRPVLAGRRSIVTRSRSLPPCAGLGAEKVRYVPWLPYPGLVLAELAPPIGFAFLGAMPVLLVSAQTDRF